MPTSAPSQPLIAVPAGKLNAPSICLAHLERERLLTLLCGPSAEPVVLVRAAAGFGKSTLLAQCRARLVQQGTLSAWLTVDSTDNDVSRLLTCIDKALSLQSEPTHATGVAVSVKCLIERLSTSKMPVALFLDEFEHVNEPAALAFVRELIEQRPRHLRVFIGARGLPDIGMQRLLQRGHLLQITESELRFDLPEIAMLLQRESRLVVPTASVQRLHSVTEGWPVALMLAAAALRRTGEVAMLDQFSGSQREISQYLGEEVFAQQSAKHREFMLRTAILRELDLNLCAALCPREDAAALLHDLAAANLFVVPLEGQASTFRYHSLFSDFLRYRLQQERSDDIARLHLTASACYESAGRPVPAIEHALLGGDWPVAVHLLKAHGETLLEQGRIRLLARWFDMLPRAAVAPHALLRALHVWAVALSDGTLAAIAIYGERGQDEENDDIAELHFRVQRPFFLAMSDRHEEAYQAAGMAMAHLPSGRPMVDAILYTVMANVLSVLGDAHRAIELTERARKMPSSSAFIRMFSESTQGLIDLQAGRLRHAIARFRLARSHEHLNDSPHRTHGGNAWVAVMYACTLYETQAFDEADRLLVEHLPTTREIGLSDHLISAYVARSRMAWERGEGDLAAHWLFELEHVGHQRGLQRVAAAAKLESARLLMLQGQPEAARRALLLAEDERLWARVRRLRLPAHETEDLLIGRARWEIAFGDAQLAVAALRDEFAQAVDRRLRWLKLMVLHCLAMRKLGDDRQAIKCFEPVLRICREEGFVRLILDEGPAVAALLQPDSAPAADYDRSDPELHEYRERLLSHLRPPAPEDTNESWAERASGGLAQKELQLLKLLAHGGSNREISDAMCLSESTVRTYLRRIHQKLGVASRTQAVAVARKRGFLS